MLEQRGNTVKKKLSIGRLLVAIILLIIAIPISYALYVMLQYSRIPDNTTLDIERTASKPVLRIGNEYTATSYNIGFGAYGPDFSFFMDTGTMADGTAVKGTYGKAIDRESVLRNMNGAIKAIQTIDPDIMLFQEVDKKSNRAYFVNEKKMLDEGFPETSSIYASNFHTAYLCYPFNDPHGATEAGLVTLSKLPVEEAVRRSYPVDDSFPTKFFDLDRCFSVCYLPVENGKTLVLVNSHMSAYDEGGKIREQQLGMLNDFMEEMYAEGNYVIVGGDYNHILGSDLLQTFPTKQQVPDWIAVFDDKDIAKGMRIVKAENRTTVPTCRSADITYRKGVNYTSVLDGFIVSDNVKATAKDIQTNFAWSDHEPVLLTFTLL